MKSDERCTTELHRNWTWVRCPNKAKYGDKCGVHDPERMKARREKAAANRQPSLSELRAMEIKSLRAKNAQLKAQNERLISRGFQDLHHENAQLKARIERVQKYAASIKASNEIADAHPNDSYDAVRVMGRKVLTLLGDDGDE